MADSADPQRLLRLNRQLMRVVLRAPGSPPFEEEESRLVEDIVNLGWLPRENALAVCGLLLPRWRSGQMTHFTRRYLRWAWWQLQTTRQHLTLSLDPALHGGGDPAAVWVLVRDLLDTFRSTLKEPSEQLLFDAWRAHEGRQGWQHEFVQQQSVSDSWVSRRLRGFRERLQLEHGISDPDALVRLLQGDPQLGLDPDEPLQEEFSEPAEETRLSESLEWLRQSLYGKFPASSRERQFMDDMYAGLTCLEIRARYEDQVGLLDRLHAGYCALAEGKP